MHFWFPKTKIFSSLSFLFAAVLSFFLFNPLGFAVEGEKLTTNAKTIIDSPQPNQNLGEEVETVADSLQYSKTEHQLVGDGNVVVVYGDIELTADHAEIQVDTKKAHAKGHVVVRQRGGGTISGDEAFFDFKTSQGSFPNGRLFHFPWYGYAEHLELVNKNKIKAQNVYITSCDLPHPHYDIKAKEATIYPGDKIIAKNVVFRILGVPVFWWPYLVIPLNNNSPVEITPGYSNRYGAFVLVSKGIAINRNINGKFHLDWFSKRGIGYGADFNYKFDQLGVGQVRLYGINDKQAPNQQADNPYADHSQEYRGRFTWKHKMRLDPLTTLQLQWNEISDDRFLQDFFNGERQQEIDPQTFITITRNAVQYSLLAHIEKRTNNFQTVGEKLPELVFTWLRKPLFGTNFYYTNEEGFVNFNQTKAFSPDGPNTVQFYTDQELSYPLHFFRFYSFVPFVNFREDYFTKSREKEDGISRYVAGGGFDSRTRFYKQWDYTNHFLGIEINQLRHVLEPVIQYNSIKHASVNPTKLVVTGRGDQLDERDVISFGIENRLQTKRKVKNSKSMQRVDLISFNAFLDYSFGPGSDLLRTRANKFTDARFETTLRPYDWMAFRMETDYDFLDKEVFTNNLDLVFNPGRFHITLSDRYTNDRSKDSKTVSNLVVEQPHLSIDDAGSNHQLTTDLIYDLNKRWKVGGYVRWRLNKNVIEEWEIRAQRDLHDWLLDFGFNVRNGVLTNPDSHVSEEAFVQLRLKALPEIQLKAGHRASFADSRIGNTVSGSNEAPQPSYFTFSPDVQHTALTAS